MGEGGVVGGHCWIGRDGWRVGEVWCRCGVEGMFGLLS